MMRLTLASVSFVFGAALTGCGDRGDGSPQPAPFGGGGGGGAGAGTVAERLNASARAVIPDKPGRNWVFDAYVSTDSPDAAWSRFWTRSIDFSGVAWDTTQNLTMVSPRHAVMARHYQRQPGHRLVKMHDARGRELQRVIVGAESLVADIAVVILNEDVPSGVRHYPVLAPSERYAEELPGAFVFATDQERKVHVHQVLAVRGRMVAFERAAPLDTGFYEALVTGDSGNPSFVLVRGEPVLLETHTTGGPGAGPFYGSAENIADINAAMLRLSEAHGAPEYQLRTVVP